MEMGRSKNTRSAREAWWAQMGEGVGTAEVGEALKV